MDLSLLAVDYSKAPPEGTGHNGGGIQGETKVLFYKENTDFTNRKVFSNGNPLGGEGESTSFTPATFEHWMFSFVTEQKLVHMSNLHPQSTLLFFLPELYKQNVAVLCEDSCVQTQDPIMLAHEADRARK